MGGGMMGRRMGYSEGSKKGKIPTTPKEKSLKNLHHQEKTKLRLVMLLLEELKELKMAKLCPRGKAAAKRKFKVYPSAYANMYASAVCSGKVTPGGKKKREKSYGWWSHGHD